MHSSVKKAVIYTDGACLGNPGKGGYAAIVSYGNNTQELVGAYKLTTNNRMELSAVIAGIESLPGKEWHIVVYADSRYVVDAVEKKWLNSWIKKKFKGKKNPDLWQRFWQLAQEHTIELKWVKGHAGHPMNERCDKLCVQAANRGPWQKDQGYLQTSQPTTLPLW